MYYCGYAIVPTQEYIEHYRTKGSRNGRRLYQYPDGTLTPLGKEHYRELRAKMRHKIDRYAKRKGVNIKNQLRKPISEMTDDEIRERIRRVGLENDLRKILPKEDLAPPPESFTKKVLKTLGDQSLEALKPLVKSGTTSLYNAVINTAAKRLGFKVPGEAAKAKAAAMAAEEYRKKYYETANQADYAEYIFNKVRGKTANNAKFAEPPTKSNDNGGNGKKKNNGGGGGNQNNAANVDINAIVDEILRRAANA